MGNLGGAEPGGTQGETQVWTHEEAPRRSRCQGTHWMVTFRIPGWNVGVVRRRFRDEADGAFIHALPGGLLRFPVTPARP